MNGSSSLILIFDEEYLVVEVNGYTNGLYVQHLDKPLEHIVLIHLHQGIKELDSIQTLYL